MSFVSAIVVALIAAIPGTVAAVLANRVRKSVKVPSGGTIGTIVDSTNGLAGITVAHTTELVKAEHKRSNGDGEKVV